MIYPTLMQTKIPSILRNQLFVLEKVAVKYISLTEENGHAWRVGWIQTSQETIQHFFPLETGSEFRSLGNGTSLLLLSCNHSQVDLYGP